MPLSFLGKNSKRRSTTLVKLRTHQHTIVHTNLIFIDMFTSSREIALFYQTVEMGARHPNEEGKLEERGVTSWPTRGGEGGGRG